MSRVPRLRSRTSKRLGWFLSLSVGVALLWLASSRLVRDPLAAGVAAYEQRAWDKAEAEARERLKERPDDREAWRLLARSLGRRGRNAEALAIYHQRVGLDAMTGEDTVIAASGLLRMGMTGQARFVLDKARAREPDHPEMLYELARLDVTTDHLAEAEELAERLTTRPGWEIKGWLLLGQAREKLDDPAGTAEAIHRALRLDPNLTGSNSPAAEERKRLARASLRAGRPADARESLASSPGRSGDPEASWLLSRALLQQGNIEEATAALTRSKGAGRRDPTLPEPSPFVGAARCAECHASIYRVQQSSRHAGTFHQAGGLAELPTFDGPIEDSGDRRVKHVLRREGGRLDWETTDAEKIRRAVVDYAFGSGGVAITMVGRDEAGGPCELRLSRYGNGATWDVTTGHLDRPDDRREFLGRPLPRDGVRRCLECHTTSVHVALERSGPAAADRGIGCERCHGPGANHLEAIAGRFADLAIGRPRGASAEQVMALCAACHSPKDLELVPDDHLAPRFASPSMAWSRCYTESRGSLSCVSCHNPHGNAETSTTFYESRCLACHARSSPAASPVSLATPRLPMMPEDVRRVPCPVDPSRGCLECHMPKVEGIVPHTSFTDHRIRVRRKAAAAGH